MSRCRCKDIDKTKKKIEKLKRAKAISPQYDAKKSTINNGLCNTVNYANEMTLSQFVMNYQGNTVMLCEDMTGARDTIKSAIDKKQDELSDLLSDLKHEDKKYHDRKKHKH